MKKGFTLIELLVVIAIIAILAAILFPVFAKAREKARQSSCSSNIKQIALSVMQYVQDYDESFPISHRAPDGDGYQRRWVETIQAYCKNIQMFKCPSDGAVVSQWTTVPVAERVPTSYMQNYQLSQKALAVVDKPASTVYGCEGGAAQTTAGLIIPIVSHEGCWILDDPINGRNDWNWGGVNPRHAEMGNVAFVDGHVKSMKFDSWDYPSSPWLNPAVGG